MLFLEAGDADADWASVRAVASASAAVQVVSLASHIAFLFPIAVTARYRLMLALVLSAIVPAVSLAYHTCVTTDMCFGATAETLRVDDHVTATLVGVALLSFFFVRDEVGARRRRAVLLLRPVDAPAAPVGLDEADALAAAAEDEALLEAALYEDDGAPGDQAAPPPAYHLQFTRLWLPFVLVAIFIAVHYHPYDIYPVVVTLVLGALTILVYHVVFRVDARPVALASGDGHLVWEAPVNWLWIALAAASGAAGVVCFFFDYRNPLLHALWHSLAACALGFAALAVVL